MPEGLQVYQDLQTGTVAALVMKEDGSPFLESHPDVRRGKPCYALYAVARKVSLCVVRLRMTRPPDPKEYRAISKGEAQEIDRLTEYSMYGVFAAATGTSLVGRFFEEMGKEGKDWYEVAHLDLQPSLVCHGDVAAILADQDFYHVACAGKAYGIEVINKAITMQRTHDLRAIVETNSLYEAAPKVGANLISVIWKGVQQEPECCSGCHQLIGKEEGEEE